MVEFTDAAIQKFKNALDPEDFVRVGVVGGGCAGLSYTVEVIEDPTDDDFIVEIDSIKVCLSPYSKFVLNSTVVDYVESLHQSGFKFENPEAAKSCGCGTSFRLPKGSPKPPEEGPGCATSGCGYK
tara:strand:+ start:883 stop:1260 length:378 start_codon:yes stop_codon:yes gene_type:complete